MTTSATGMNCWKVEAGLAVGSEAAGMLFMLDGLGKTRQAEFGSRGESFDRWTHARERPSSGSDKGADLWCGRFSVDQISRNTDLQHGGAVVLDKAKHHLEMAAEVIGGLD